MSTPAVCMSNKNGANSAAPILCARPLARPLAHTAEQRFMWTHDRPFLDVAPLAPTPVIGDWGVLFSRPLSVRARPLTLLPTAR